MATDKEEEMELLKVSRYSTGSASELPGSGWGGDQTGKTEIFADYAPEEWACENCGSNFRDQILHFCGIGDDDDEAEQWEIWQARKRMLSKRMTGKEYRQPQPLPDESMVPQGIHVSPYEGDEIDGKGRKKCRLYSKDKIHTIRPGRRVTRQGPISKPDLEPLYKVFYRNIKELFSPPKKSEKRERMKSRSFAPADISEYGPGIQLFRRGDEVDSGTMSPQAAVAEQRHELYDSFFNSDVHYTGPDAYPLPDYPGPTPGFFDRDGSEGMTPQATASVGYDEPDNATWVRPRTGGWEWREPMGEMYVPPGARDYRSEGMEPMGRYEGEGPSNPFQAMSRFSKQVKDNFVSYLDNSDRWDATKSTFISLTTDGVFSKVCGFQYDRYYKYAYDRETGTVKADRTSDHRSGFTAWMTFVQILICIVSVSVYDFAPFGISQTEVSMEILQPSLTLEKLSYKEPSSFWLGPRQADLIHLGAKFSPCMRLDSNVEAALKLDRIEENKTACCIYNDGSGCLQSSRGKCPAYLATFLKWSEENPGPDNRVSGSVCGQDPKYCKNPASLGAYEWPDDITEWPVCKDSAKPPASQDNRHVNCEIRGRPCCYGIQGECMITTREHCEFLRGYFHEDATLCSQVPCMSEMCGMLPFGDPDVPDQFYRLFISIFLHAGLLHLFVTIIYNLFILRPAEVMIGWIRTVVIFFGSGIAGSLASAIFLPYLVSAGPAGAHLGIIACHMVLIILFVEDRKRPLIKISCFVLALLIFGLLPMVDNYAHIFGFIFGFLISFAVLPFARFSDKVSASTAKTRRYIAIGVCSAAAVGVAILLIILFYVAPIYDCAYCHYFTCIPITNDFCVNQEVKMRQVVEL